MTRPLPLLMVLCIVTFAVPAPAQDWNQAISAGTSAFIAGDAAAAIEILEPVFATLQPTTDWRTPYVVVLLSKAYVAAERPESSLMILPETLERLPDDAVELKATLLTQLGIARNMTGDRDGARTALEEARDVLGNGHGKLRGEIEINLGTVAAAEERFAAALGHFENAVALLTEAGNDAGASEARLGRIWMLEILGRLEDSDAAVASLADPEEVRHIRIQLAELMLDRNPRRTIHWLSGLRLEELPPATRVGRLETLGVAHFDLGELTEAYAIFSEIVTLGREQGDPVIESRGLRHQGGAAQELGRPREAIRLLRRSIELDPGEDPKLLQDLYLKLADALRQVGDTGEARAALAHASAALDDAGPQVQAAIESQLGNLHMIQGDLTAAEASYRRALKLLSSPDKGTRSIAVGRDQVEGNLANVLVLQGRLKEAEKLLRSQLKRNRDDPFASTRIRLALGNALRASDPAQARKVFADAQASAEITGHPALRLAAQHNLGLIELDEGNWAAALAHYEAAIALTREDPDPAAAFDVYAGAATALSNQDRPQDALDALEQALEAHERLRAGALGPGREDIQSRALGFYDRAIELALTIGQVARAWRLTERSRSRTLLDRLTASDSATPIPELERERLAWGEVLGTRERMDRARDELTFNAAQAAYLSAIGAYQDVVESIIAKCPLCLTAEMGSPPDLSTLQSRLGETLVSYFTLDSGIIAFVLDRQRGISVRRLDVRAETIAGLLEALLRFDSKVVPPTNLLRQLYDALWAPIADLLEGRQKIIVAPHGTLHRVPFAALDQGHSYLVRDREIAVLPSASVLALLPGAAPGTDIPVVVGISAGLDEPLVFAAQEARRVADLYSVAPLIDSDATETRVRTALPQATVAHFATHATLDPENPFASALALSTSGEDDGRLQLAEILGLRLGARPVVVLSACETQRGRLGPGDELAALQRGFLASGARAIVASLWVVDDQATEELMAVFHTGLRRGLPVPTALREAQQHLLAIPRWRHPFYWAAFVPTAERVGTD